MAHMGPYKKNYCFKTKDTDLWCQDKIVEARRTHYISSVMDIWSSQPQTSSLDSYKIAVRVIFHCFNLFERFTGHITSNNVIKHSPMCCCDGFFFWESALFSDVQGNWQLCIYMHTYVCMMWAGYSIHLWMSSILSGMCHFSWNSQVTLFVQCVMGFFTVVNKTKSMFYKKMILYSLYVKMC